MSCIALVGTIVMPSPDTMAADALGRHFHLGQPAAVGADADDLVGRKFQEHAAQGIAAAFVVGGEHRAADQLFEQPGRKLVIFRFGKVGHRRKFVRVFGRQAELAAFAADHGRLASASIRNCSSLLSRRIEPKRATGKTAAAGNLHVDSGQRSFARPPPDRSPGRWPKFSVDLELDVLQDRLGAAGGATAAAV